MTGLHYSAFFRVILYMFFLAGLVFVVRIDASAGAEKFYEDSWTEIAQELIFFILALGYLFIARSRESVSTVSYFFAGFFAVCFVRELDALLEHNIGTGAWQVFATLILIAMGVRVQQDWQGFKSQLEAYSQTYAFGLLVAGCLTTFAFSRLLGGEDLWMIVMEDSYMRNVKNAVEESVELLGDALMLFGGIEFLLCQRRSPLSSESEAA